MLRAARLLLALRIRRLLNMFGSRFAGRAKPGGARRATSPKQGGLTLPVILGTGMVIYAAFMAWHAVSNVRDQLGEPRELSSTAFSRDDPDAADADTADSDTSAADTSAAGRHDGVRSDDEDRAERARRLVHSFRELQTPRGLSAFTPPVTDGFVLVLTLVAVAALAMALGAKELAAPEWDMEWLVTLPIPRRTLLAVRLVERTLVNPVAVLFMAPFLSVLAWERGAGPVGSPLLGLALTAPLLLLVGALRLAVDTGVRVRLQPARLRNLQAVLAIVGLALFYLALSASLSQESFVLGWARHLPALLHWLPTGLAVDVLATHGSAARPALLLLLEVGAVVAAVMLGVQRLLARGIVTHGGRETTRVQAATTATAQRSAAGALVAPGEAVGAPAASRNATGALVAPGEAAGPPARRWLTPIQAREIRLLMRDRNFLVQTLVLPVLIIGAQFFFNARLIDTIGSEPAHLAAMSFGLAAYVLMFSAFQTLNAEGQSLWILYTVPVPLDVLLRQKAQLWGAITLIYPLAMVAFFLRGGFTAETASLMAVVLLGVPVYAMLAVCIGVLGSNPLSQDTQRRVRGGSAYLFMLLASMYTYAIYSASLWQRLTLMLLCASLAFALWQKVRDRLPYLLDPTARPPAHVSLSDGLIAALVFFVLQGIVFGAAVAGGHVAMGPAVFLAFLVAGAVTYLAMLVAFAKQHATGVPRMFGERVPRAVALGLAAGAAAAACGVGYLAVIRDIPSLQDMLRDSALLGEDLSGWLVPLAILAAPVFEEFIFRGLIFGGLRRTFGRWPAALMSAAIFAMCHGPISFLPVFVVGVGAALVYDATGMLLAPMIAHGLYNAVVLAAPWFLSR